MPADITIVDAAIRNGLLALLPNSTQLYRKR